MPKSTRIMFLLQKRKSHPKDASRPLTGPPDALLSRPENPPPGPALPVTSFSGFSPYMDENTAAAPNNPRKERLAKALRDNLKRRKAQARQRAAADSQERGIEGSDPGSGPAD